MVHKITIAVQGLMSLEPLDIAQESLVNTALFPPHPRGLDFQGFTQFVSKLADDPLSFPLLLADKLLGESGKRKHRIVPRS